MALSGGSMASSHPASRTRALAPIRANGHMPRWISSLSAPLCRSPATSRMATNGSRNTAASSQALNVGAQTPISGESASPTPAAVPFRPLTSAYVRTALMNETPTSGPMPSSSTHHDRETTSSRHSLLRSQKNGGLREGKKDLFQEFVSARHVAGGCQRRQLREGARAADAAAGEQDEPVAEARRIADLMDGEEQ